jgi:hypothetical protein
MISIKAPLRINKTKALFAAACACTLFLSPPVMADDAPLVPEAAALDTTPSPPPSASTAAPESTVLQGGVKKHQHPDVPAATPQTQPLQANATDNDAALQAEQGNRDDNPVFKMAAAKLESGKKLTAEEYRSLQAGCVGYESDRTFFTDIAKVSIVYKDSPAEKAGIRKGDKLVDHENDDEARADPTQPRQGVTCGLAGSTVTITVLRHNKPEPLTLTRMNIEDIQEPDIRREWEGIVRRLGYPKEGTFSGTSFKNLKRVSDDQ